MIVYRYRSFDAEHGFFDVNYKSLEAEIGSFAIGFTSFAAVSEPLADEWACFGKASIAFGTICNFSEILPRCFPFIHHLPEIIPHPHFTIPNQFSVSHCRIVAARVGSAFEFAFVFNENGIYAPDC